MVAELDPSMLPSIDDVEAEIQRRAVRFRDMIPVLKPDFIFSRVHDTLIDILQRFAEGEFPRLIIQMPPRHGKSELVSRLFPAYLIGRDPRSHIIAMSYAAGLANRMSRDVRRNVRSELFGSVFPGVKIGPQGKGDDTVLQADLFEVSEFMGSYKAAGFNVGVTGMGGNWILIDDPIKGRQAADSRIIRDNVYNTYIADVRSREQPDSQGRSGILITHTPWHEDDLSGRVLRDAEENEDADQWTVVRLPALAENAI